jgi:hypothetical protein
MEVQVCYYCRRPRSEVEATGPARCEAARRAGSVPFHNWKTQSEIDQSFSSVAERWLKSVKR